MTAAAQLEMLRTLSDIGTTQSLTLVRDIRDFDYAVKAQGLSLKMSRLRTKIYRAKRAPQEIDWVTGLNKLTSATEELAALGHRREVFWAHQMMLHRRARILIQEARMMELQAGIIIPHQPQHMLMPLLVRAQTWYPPTETWHPPTTAAPPPSPSTTPTTPPPSSPSPPPPPPPPIAAAPFPGFSFEGFSYDSATAIPFAVAALLRPWRPE